MFHAPRRLRRFVQGSTVAAALALATLASTLATPAANADDPSAQMDIVQFAFSPATLEVPAGTTVTWLNHDAIVHSVTNGTDGTAAGAFDSGLFDQGVSYSFTFTDPGNYPYFCMRHNFMHGTITVTPA